MGNPAAGIIKALQGIPRKALRVTYFAGIIVTRYLSNCNSFCGQQMCKICTKAVIKRTSLTKQEQRQPFQRGLPISADLSL